MCFIAYDSLIVFNKSTNIHILINKFFTLLSMNNNMINAYL